MGSSEKLQALAAERDGLLGRITEVLRADGRVAAAWLHGSLGRGTADEWSDIDLWVVVADEHIEALSADRHDYVSKPGEPLLIVDAQQNAPRGGAFLSVVYGSEAGPLLVDWNWQPASDAALPHDARLLFDRVGVRAADAPQPPNAEGQHERARNQVSYFWMMLPVVAKYIARRRAWGVVNLLNMLRYTLVDVAELTGQRADVPYDPAGDSVPPAQPAEQLAALRSMARYMEGLMARTEDIRDAVSPEAIRQIEAAMDLAAGTLSVPE